MDAPALGLPWVRRARPLLGTLVEIGVPEGGAAAEAALAAAFAAIGEVQSCLSRFEPASEVSRFHALPAGASLRIGAHMAAVLTAARELAEATADLFDISLGSAPAGWRCDGRRLHKLDPRVRLDLGGIGKGHAVDHAVETLRGQGCLRGWVNAGGDLRVFGDVELPLSLRDEHGGGVRPFATLHDGAFATSHFGRCSRSQATAAGPVHAHASVAAPSCLWADALTKVVAISGDARHPVLAHHAAQAWLH